MLAGICSFFFGFSFPSLQLLSPLFCASLQMNFVPSMLQKNQPWNSNFVLPLCCQNSPGKTALQVVEPTQKIKPSPCASSAMFNSTHNHLLFFYKLLSIFYIAHAQQMRRHDQLFRKKKTASNNSLHIPCSTHAETGLDWSLRIPQMCMCCCNI